MAKNTEAQVEATIEAPVFDYAKLLEEHKTVSATIRYLDSKGLKRGEIAKITGKRYQHVRNVLVTPLKKND